jgi:hypothetical protein
MPNTVSAAEIKQSVIDALKSMATFQNFIFVAWFLAVYSITYTITTLFQNPSDTAMTETVFNRSADFLILCSILLLIVFYYFSLNETDKQNVALNILVLFRNFLDNLNSIFKMAIVMTFFYLILYGFKIKMGFNEKPATISFIEKILWIITLILLFTQFFKYAFKISITDIFFGKKNTSAPHSTVTSNARDSSNASVLLQHNSTTGTNGAAAQGTDVGLDNDDKQKLQPSTIPEVFNVANSLYTYEEAKDVCQSLGARLATAEEINKAYEDGAEWCVNSWSDNMLVLYPTQEKTYQKLQKVKGAENRCGRTGVNGGKVDNPNWKFGVNCFGIKPVPTEFEQKRMSDIQDVYSNVPKSKEELFREAKINYWLKNKDKFMIINPFNTDKWSEA